MTQPAIRVVFAGGGTGGHLFPAIRIAKYLKKHWGADCIFIGTKKGIEYKKVPQAGFLLRPIWISGFRRSLSLSNLLFPIKLLVSSWQSRKWLHSFRPDLVIGTGGYVSGPVLRQALKMKITTAIQEQNSYPGVTTRLLAKKVDQVFVAYREALDLIGDVNSVQTVGNPIDEKIGTADKKEAIRFFDLKTNLPVMLVFGGSQGAGSINRAIAAVVRNGLASKIQVIWQTGNGQFQQIADEFKAMENENLRIYPFIDRMDMAYAASDLAVCRAGAMTLSELAAAALPAVLVPYPHAAADHQYKNARAVSTGGAAVVIRDDENMDQQLEVSINTLVSDREKMKLMAENMKKFHFPEATARIADTLYRLLEQKGKLN